MATTCNSTHCTEAAVRRVQELCSNKLEDLCEGHAARRDHLLAQLEAEARRENAWEARVS